MANPANDMNNNVVKSLKKLLAKHVTVNGVDGYNKTKMIVHSRDYLEGTDLRGVATYEYQEFYLEEIIDIDKIGILGTQNGGTSIRLVPWSAIASVYIR